MKLEYSNDDDRHANACPSSPRSSHSRRQSRSLRINFIPSDEEGEPVVSVAFHDDNDGSVICVDVPQGTKITEAATKAGVYIVSMNMSGVCCLLFLLLASNTNHSGLP